MYCIVDIKTLTPCQRHFVFRRGLAICISRFICLDKTIRYKYKNRLKSRKFENLVFIAEAENIIRKKSGVSNVYMASHTDFESVEFYATRRYMYLINEVRE